MVVFEDMFDAMTTAGVSATMVNSVASVDLDSLSAMLPSVVPAAVAHLDDQLEDQIARVKDRLNQTMQRLSSWQIEARAVADSMTPGAQRNRRREDIDRVTRRIKALVQENQPAASPLIRVVGALVPKG